MEIICDYCKKPYQYRGGVVHFNRTNGHYCSRSCQNAIHGLARRGQKDKRYTIWCGAKKRAKKKGIEFNLLIEDIPQVPEICPILGINIIANITNSPLDSSPSLDRINPLLGYIVGNVRIISNRANRIKADATLEELKLILKDAEEISNG